MKKFLTILSVFATILIASCNGCHQQAYNDDYRIMTGPNGQQMAVYHDASGAEMMMNYMLFQQLMSSTGGYNNVRSYYQTHTNVAPVRYNASSYAKTTGWSSTTPKKVSYTTTPAAKSSAWQSSTPTKVNYSTSSSTPSTKSSVWGSSSRSTPSSTTRSSSWGSSSKSSSPSRSFSSSSRSSSFSSSSRSSRR